MKTVPIHDAKTNLSKYIAAAKKGEKIYIGGFGKAEVVLIKVSAQERRTQSGRDFSVAKGKVTAGPGAFARQTEDHITSLMLGGD